MSESLIPPMRLHLQWISTTAHFFPVVCQFLKISVPEPDDIVPRKATVEALYQCLQNYGFIQVRRTPGSGKTTFCQLLARRILQQPNTDVIRINEWPVKEGMREERTVFIFDNAELTLG